MGKFFKQLLIFLGILLIVVVLGAAIVASVFGDQIGQQVLQEVNKQLKTELSVEEVDISVFSSFPSAAVNLRQIKMEDTQGGILLEAENLAFKFGLFSLFGSSIKVRSIVAENGALNIKINQQGEGNYDVMKEAPETVVEETTDTSDGLGFSLDEASLQNIELIYEDQQTMQNVVMLLDNARFSGDYTGDDFSLLSDAQIQSKFVEIDGARFFVGKPLSYDAKIGVNFDNEIYTFEEVTLAVAETDFTLTGTITEYEKFSDYNLAITSEEGTLGSVMQLMPDDYLQSMGEFTSRGKFVFDALIEGRSSATESPIITSNLSLEDGSISSPQLDSDLKDVSFTASFSNGKERSNKTSSFEISNLKGYFNRELIELQLNIENFDDPKIDFLLDGVLPLSAVYGLLESPSVTDGDGEIEIKQLRLQGRYEDMINPSRISRVKASGQLEFDDAELTINEEELVIDKGDVILSDNMLSIQNVEIEGAGSEIFLDGTFYNILPVLFADSLNSQRAELKFGAILSAEEMDLDRLVNLTLVSVDEEDVSKETFDSLQVQNNQQREFITKFLKGTFDVKVNNFNYGEIVGKDFIGKLTFDNNEATIKGATVAMDGDLDLNGVMYFEGAPRLKAKLSCKNLDFREFFRQSENFGQDVLVYKNVGGRIDSKILIEAFFDKEGNFDYDKLHVLAGISIKDGELVNFGMLEDFSTYIKLEDLRHIKFTDEKNYLEIKNQKIYIPIMFIQSNALNLTMNGEHTFENDMDYNIKINAGQVVANRFKRANPDKTPQKAKRNGWFNIYYKIFGNIEDYQYESARKEIKKDFAKSEHRKRQIKNALIREFGTIELFEEPQDWQDIPEFGDPDEEVEYLDGFDEIGGGK